MNSARWKSSLSVGIVVLLIAGCATKSGSPAPSPEMHPQNLPAKPAAEDNMLRDWARDLEAKEEEAGGESEFGAGGVTLADIKAASLFISGLLLVEAAGKGDIEQVKELLKEADANAKDKAGTTALMAAAGNGHAEICRILLEAGANPSLKNQDGKSAADLAQAAGFEEVLALVKEKAD